MEEGNQEDHRFDAIIQAANEVAEEELGSKKKVYSHEKDTPQKVLDAMRDHNPDIPKTGKEIQELTGLRPGQVAGAIYRLKKEGLIEISSRIQSSLCPNERPKQGYRPKKVD
jgi:DNA-binding MarR family transcriptional regulator